MENSGRWVERRADSTDELEERWTGGVRELTVDVDTDA